MKVHELVKKLQALDPDEHICALYWAKESFDFHEDDNLHLSDKRWEQVCEEFDLAEFITVGEWIADAVLEYAEIVERL